MKSALKTIYSLNKLASTSEYAFLEIHSLVRSRSVPDAYIASLAPSARKEQKRPVVALTIMLTGAINYALTSPDGAARQKRLGKRSRRRGVGGPAIWHRSLA